MRYQLRYVREDLGLWNQIPCPLGVIGTLSDP